MAKSPTSIYGKGLILRAADGMTLPELAKEMRQRLEQAADDAMVNAAKHAKKLIDSEGGKHHIKARRTFKPVKLFAKIGPHSPKKSIVYGKPEGFWVIVETGAKEHRIERKVKFGSTKKTKYSGATVRLLGRKGEFGPVPYVLHAHAKPSGHPWEIAMIKVEAMPQSVFDPAVVKAMKPIWTG